MKSSNLVVLFVLMGSILFAQENENFIKIVGQASETIEANGIFAKFKIEEVERNEYQKIQSRQLEDVKADLLAHLDHLGYKLSDMTELLPNTSGYNQKLNENYSMIFKNIEDFKEFKQAPISGFSVTEVKYAFDNSIKIDDKKLAEKAITDARKKAESLAKHLNKKVGSVISIHDRSYSSFNIPTENRTDHYTIKYEVTISFELLSK